MNGYSNMPGFDGWWVRSCGGRADQIWTCSIHSQPSPRWVGSDWDGWAIAGPRVSVQDEDHLFWAVVFWPPERERHEGNDDHEMKRDHQPPTHWKFEGPPTRWKFEGHTFDLSWKAGGEASLLFPSCFLISSVFSLKHNTDARLLVILVKHFWMSCNRRRQRGWPLQWFQLY